MDHDTEAAIRDLAYEIWEREGRPDGLQAVHWAQAERELMEAREEEAERQQASATPAGGRRGT